MESLILGLNKRGIIDGRHTTTLEPFYMMEEHNY